MDNTKKKCDIFISYRRDGGDMTAMYIYQELKDRKYDVFYDLEVLRAGKFNDSLLEYIDSCKDFVLVLSPRALDRCNDENDWVRKEIAEALRLKKNIIPIMLKGFAFPEKLPDEIDDVRYQNGLTATTEYFQESMNRLCNKYMISKSKKNTKLPVAAAAAGLTLVVGLGVGGKFYLSQNENKTQTAVVETAVNKEPEQQAEAIKSEIEELTESPVEKKTEEDTEAGTQTDTQKVISVSHTDWPVMRIDSPWTEYNERYVSVNEDVSNVPNMPVFHNDKLLRKDVSSITFLNTLENAGKGAWDISEEQDGSVMAWTEQNGELFDLYIAGEGGVRAPERCDGLFCKYENLQSINFNNCFDLSECENCYSFFQGLGKMKSLDLRSLDVSSVKKMTSFFYDCVNLESVDLSNWNTVCAEEMDNMFFGCINLKELDLSSFNTSRVYNMGSMFQDVRLKKLDLSSFDTSRVTIMGGMFIGDIRLEELILGDNFNTSRVKDMEEMFGWCHNLLELDVSGFDTSKVESMKYMFEHCERLMELDVSGFDTSNVTDMTGMFEACHQLDGLDVSEWNVEKVKKMSNIFSRCDELTDIGTKSGKLWDQFNHDRKQTEGAKYWSRNDLWVNSDSEDTVSVIWSAIDDITVKCPYAYDEASGHSYVFVNCPATGVKANGYWGDEYWLACINSKEELEFLEQWAERENLNFHETWIMGNCDPRYVYAAAGVREEYDPDVSLESLWYERTFETQHYYDPQEKDVYFAWDESQPDESGFWLQLCQWEEDGHPVLRMDDLDDDRRRPFILETNRKIKPGEKIDISWWSYGGNEKEGYGEEYLLGDDNIRGRLDVDGLFTVSGSGEISLGGADYVINIKKVIIKDGITTIGFHAFDNDWNLTEISIPESVTSIGPGAFMSAGLEDITIPSSVNEIAEDAFDGIENILTIHGESGSYAETYAKEKGIKFQEN